MTEPRQPSPLVAAAAAIAERAHEGQTRRQGTPYIEHPRAVRDLTEDLLVALGRAVDDEIVAAALCHDVLEDSAITHTELGLELTPRVADLVQALTKPAGDKSATWSILADHDDDAVRILKAADRAHNLYDLQFAEDPSFVDRKVRETEEKVLGALTRCRDQAVGAALGAVLEDGLALLKGTPRASAPGLYLIVNVDPERELVDIERLVRGGAAAGASLIQLRAKGVSDRDAIQIGRAATRWLEESGSALVVNDRADIARTVGAGVHVGFDDLPPADCRAIVGEAAVVGASSHTDGELRTQLASESLDYVAYGPVFLSATKQGHAEVTGLEALADACRASTLPVCAIGGIDGAARVAEVARAGAHFVAVISAVERASDPGLYARRLHLSFIAAHAAHRARGESEVPA